MKKLFIEAKNLSKKYKNKYAVKNANLKIYEGDKIAIIGANGAGKSTLVEMLAGIRKPTSGKIIYGIDNPKRNIGIQIQDTSFPDGLKLKDIVNFYCTVFKKEPKSKEIQSLINFFQLHDFLNTWVSRMSGGERQRANALLTIISNPKLLIVDEMATGLDITAKIELISFINNYVKENKVTYVTISHSETEVSKTANRVVLMEDGQIVTDKSLKDFGGHTEIFNYFQRKVRGE